MADFYRYIDIAGIVGRKPIFFPQERLAIGSDRTWNLNRQNFPRMLPVRVPSIVAPMITSGSLLTDRQREMLRALSGGE